MPCITLSHPSAGQGQLHYQDYGQGQPVVLIHGWPLSGRSWEAQIGPLVEAGYRVVAYDRRGFGASCQPWEGYDYDTFAQDLQDLLQALDLRDAVLVGFSMGGGEVARYVAKFGTERIAKLVFAAAVPPYLYQCDDNPEGVLKEADIQAQQTALQQDRMAFLEDFTQKFFTPQGGKLAVSEDQRMYAKAMAAFASPKGTVDCVAAFARTDFREDLKAIRIPTLIVHGDSDQIVPLTASGQRTHAMVAGSQLQVIEGAPHGCNVSHAQAFNAALIDFLQG